SPSVLGAEYLRASKLACISWMTGALQALMAQRRIAVAEPESLAHLINGGLMDAALWVAHHLRCWELNICGPASWRASAG
ncbi:hypothetical protein CQA18_25925, partial [Enterobacter hormaechei]